MSTFGLDRALAPKAVAVIGGSPRSSSLGAAVLKNLHDGGFSGPIAVVNPSHRFVGGQPTYPNLSAVPFTPDLVVVTAPAPSIPEIIAEVAVHDVAAAVILTSGLGHGAGSLAEAARLAARKHSLRLIGPNCLGVITPRARLNASFAAQRPNDGHLALISQSGAIAAAMVDWAAERAVGFSGIVSIGDQIDVDVADTLDYFAIDENTRAILLYIEEVKDARKFMSAARAAARLKPVIVVKSGRMAEGAQAAATHTGALAGSDAVYDAAFRRAGMLRVFDLRDLFDCAELLSRGQTPRGNRLMILTNGGGLGILAIDRLAELGGTAARLGPEMVTRLDQVLPSRWSRENPVDVGGDADPGRYAAALDALLEDRDSDAVLVMHVETAMASADDIAKAVVERVTIDRIKRRASLAKPVLAVWAGTDRRVASTFEAAGISHFSTEGGAVRAFMNLVRYREASEALAATPPDISPIVTPDVTAARRVVEKALADQRPWLDPAEIETLLKAYDIPLVPTLLARDAAEAVDKATPFLGQGQYVAVKIFSRDISHKSDIGGVILNLATKEDVRRGAETVMARARRARPEARIEGVMVQPMMIRPHARECVIGIADDPTFGPIIAFGRGGTAVDVIGDEALALPPLDMNLARDQVRRTRVGRLLRAYRDVPAVPEDAVPLALVKLAQMAADLPEIAELEINPLLADESGVLALDARIAIRPPRRLFAGRTRFSIRPYPTQWEGELLLKDGSRIMVRPMRPEDEPAIAGFLGEVDPEDVRLRFFHAVKDFSHTFVARLTQLDYARAMAFVAMDPNTRQIVGTVRLHSDSLYESGEYAILVRSQLKGKGLGWALMRLLIAYARSEGLKRLFGEVLHENTTMLAMCRELGFTVKSAPEDPTVANVALDLSHPAAVAIGRNSLIRSDRNRPV
ncbi:MAG TPA: bifunctional acetate--CoA ligase family protein/GNAT family N-acetyltransferase [Bradyrhizobium sp.]|nr:bifunctional acetate--CoA ligase family protein/GNAT family N-acetyltransferase [Bradyrhizobium sp.]